MGWGVEVGPARWIDLRLQAGIRARGILAAAGGRQMGGAFFVTAVEELEDFLVHFFFLSRVVGRVIFLLFSKSFQVFLLPRRIQVFCVDSRQPDEDRRKRWVFVAHSFKSKVFFNALRLGFCFHVLKVFRCFVKDLVFVSSCSPASEDDRRERRVLLPFQ